MSGPEDPLGGNPVVDQARAAIMQVGLMAGTVADVVTAHRKALRRGGLSRRNADRMCMELHDAMLSQMLPGRRGA